MFCPLEVICCWVMFESSLSRQCVKGSLTQGGIKKYNTNMLMIMNIHLKSSFRHIVNILLRTSLKILPKFYWRVNLKKGRISIKIPSLKIHFLPFLLPIPIFIHSIFSFGPSENTLRHTAGLYNIL